MRNVYLNLNMTFAYPKFHINGQNYSTMEAMKIFAQSLLDTDAEHHSKWLSTYKYALSKIGRKCI